MRFSVFQGVLVRNPLSVLSQVRFCVVNLCKSSSLYSEGQQPVAWSRRAEDLRPVVEYGLINERMVRKTKGRAGTRDW